MCTIGRDTTKLSSKKCNYIVKEKSTNNFEYIIATIFSERKKIITATLFVARLLGYGTIAEIIKIFIN